jgi:hypothetical protein
MEGRCGDDVTSFPDVMFPPRVYFQLLTEALGWGRIYEGVGGVSSASDFTYCVALTEEVMFN